MIEWNFVIDIFVCEGRATKARLTTCFTQEQSVFLLFLSASLPFLLTLIELMRFITIFGIFLQRKFPSESSQWIQKWLAILLNNNNHEKLVGGR